MEAAKKKDSLREDIELAREYLRDGLSEEQVADLFFNSGYGAHKSVAIAQTAVRKERRAVNQ